MSVSPEDVHRFASLAKLRLGPGEVERLTEDLTRILAHVELLGDLDVGEDEGWGPDRETQGTAAPEGPREPDALAHGPDRMAPAWGDGFFLLPPPRGVEPERP